MAQVRKTCRRPNCQTCARGDEHPAFIFFFTQGGKRRSMYVPKELEPLLERALRNGRQIETLLYELGPRLLRQHRQQAGQTQREILALAQAPAQHAGIQKVQNLFREQTKRRFHWTKSPKVPADNHRAERELRPLVIARKTSFDSQSEAGARTRETLVTVLHTLRQRTANVTAAFERASARLVEGKTEPYTTLGFDSS